MLNAPTYLFAGLAVLALVYGARAVFSNVRERRWAWGAIGTIATLAGAYGLGMIALLEWVHS